MSLGTQLFASQPTSDFHVAVIVPVRDEEVRLPSCLEALLGQTVPHRSYEVLLLLNNCADASVPIARAFQQAHPELQLHLAALDLPPHLANVGTARRLLMDEASARLPDAGVILSTDGDSCVAPDWIEANLAAIDRGASAVGGSIALHPGEFQCLPAPVRSLYQQDLAYLTACAHLESLLDPDPFDPWPRHHFHFGASLGCTNSLYRRLGGLPHVDTLEDVAFTQAMFRADARLRHAPEVRVHTAARTFGRARIGLASQLREWQAALTLPEVDSAFFLERYYRSRAVLRHSWRIRPRTTFGQLHESLDFRGTLWRSMPPSDRLAPLPVANAQLRALLETLSGEGRRSGSARLASHSAVSTRAAPAKSRALDRPFPDSPALPA